MQKWLRNIVIIVLAALLLGVAGVWNYARGSADAQATSITILQQPNVSIDGRTIRFAPTGTQRDIGFIFYQGGLVEEAAYAPILQAIAQAGYPVFEPAMPINLAVLGINRAAAIMEANPEITQWVIGGHSLGGAMAAQFAANNLGSVSGLVLMASYPSEASDLSQSNLPVVSIYGSNDGLATARRVRRSASLLPADTTFVEIIGGNHAQFGDYGEQERDGVATISAETQWQQTTDAIIEFLNTINRLGR